MQEARIILPMGYSPGELEDKLLQAYGGFTKMPMAYGVWLSPEGQVHDEHVIVYDVAMPDTLPNRVKLQDIAVWAREEYHQEAIYVRLPDGGVHLVDASYGRARAA